MRSTVRWSAAALALAGIVTLYTACLHVVPTTVALTLLLTVLLLAANWGLRYAVVFSFAGAACFNYYFLPPLRAFTIAETQNWIALFAFLATALIASNLSNRIRQEAETSKRRRRELELLYDFGQRLLTTETTAELLKAIPHSIVAAFRTNSAALYLLEGNRVYLSHSREMPINIDALQNTARAGSAAIDISKQTALLPLMVGVTAIGSIFVERNLPSQETLEALGGLIAISLGRASAVEKLARAEATHESERLRSALLDAVTHDLRTPLTSIKASVTSLLSQTNFNPEQRIELLTVINEESDRLNQLIAKAMEMARLDAREVHLEFAPYPVQTLVENALRAAQSAVVGRDIHTAIAPALPPIRMDLALMTKVLVHLLENAAKYSAAGEPIFITASRSGGHFEMDIADRGCGMDPLEQTMIFDKFYRGPSQRYRVQGTGMGLAISRAIMEAHGGTISVTSQEGAGSVFRLTLPMM